MGPDTASPTSGERSRDDTGSSTLVNALLGGIAGIVLSFVPLAPVLGGGIAGYLEGGTTRDGLTVGVGAGLVMAIPFALGGTVFTAYFLGLGVSPRGFLVLFPVFAILGGLYTVGFGVLGGWLGVYAKREL